MTMAGTGLHQMDHFGGGRSGQDQIRRGLRLRVQSRRIPVNLCFAARECNRTRVSSAEISGYRASIRKKGDGISVCHSASSALDENSGAFMVIRLTRLWMMVQSVTNRIFWIITDLLSVVVEPLPHQFVLGEDYLTRGHVHENVFGEHLSDCSGRNSYLRYVCRGMRKYDPRRGCRYRKCSQRHAVCWPQGGEGCPITLSSFTPASALRAGVRTSWIWVNRDLRPWRGPW